MSEPFSSPPSPPLPPSPPPIPEAPLPVAALESNLASPWKRLGAVAIDGFIYTLLFMIIGGALYPKPDPKAIEEAFMRGDFQAMAAMGTPSFFVVLIASALSVAAFIGINWKFLPNGQTVGKKLLKLQIQARSGGLLPVKDLILRRILPVYLIARLHLLGSLLLLVDALCIFRPARNTLHDDLAQSKVVQLPG